MPHFTCNYSSWWNTQDQQMSQILSKNINFRVENSPQHRQEVEHLGLQLRDKCSPSTQSSSQSIHDLNGAGTTTSRDLCVSSLHPGSDFIYYTYCFLFCKFILLLILRQDRVDNLFYIFKT